MFVIEVAGLVIRHVVLAVRLFANMFAGHVVLAVILGFILMSEEQPVLPVSGEHHRRDLAQSARAVRGVFASVYLHVSIGVFIGSAVHPH